MKNNIKIFYNAITESYHIYINIIFDGKECVNYHYEVYKNKYVNNEKQALKFLLWGLNKK